MHVFISEQQLSICGLWGEDSTNRVKYLVRVKNSVNQFKRAIFYLLQIKKVINECLNQHQLPFNQSQLFDLFGRQFLFNVCRIDEVPE